MHSLTKWLRPWNGYLISTCKRYYKNKELFNELFEEFDLVLNDFELTDEDRAFFYHMTKSNSTCRVFSYKKSVGNFSVEGLCLSLGLKIEKLLYDRCDIFFEDSTIKLILNPHNLYKYNEFTMLTSSKDDYKHFSAKIRKIL